MAKTIIKSDDEKCTTPTSETQESSGTEMESMFSEITARRNEALYNYTRNRMLNAQRFKNFDHRDYSMTSSSSDDIDDIDDIDDVIDEVASMKGVIDTVGMKFDDAATSLTSGDDQTVYTASQIELKSATDTMSENHFVKKSTKSSTSLLVQNKQCTCRCAIHNPNGSYYVDVKSNNSKTMNARTTINANNNKIQVNVQRNIQKNIPKIAPKPTQQNIKNELPNVVQKPTSKEAVKSSDSVSDIDKDLREKLMNFKLVLFNHRQQEIINEKLKKMEEYRFRNAAAQVKTPRRVTFAEVKSSETSESSTTDESGTSMDTDEENNVLNRKQTNRDYENKLLYRFPHTLPLRELVPEVSRLKYSNNDIMSVEKKKNIRHTRKNASFSNKQLREIERTNKILLQKIVSQKPTFNTNCPSSKGTIRVTSTASINRRKQQRQIDLDNQILKRKIEAIAVRKPVILK